MKNPINNTVFDSRDLIDYKNHLETELVDNWNEANPDFQALDIIDIFSTNGYEFVDETKEQFAEFEAEFESEIEHYNDVAKICSDFENCGDFEYGETIIHEDYFTEYTEELCKEIGFISKDFPPFIEIDWETTAENLKTDYIESEYEGSAFYMTA